MATTKAWREPQGRWLAGVCTGLAAHLGWPVPVVRLIFLALALANGIGILAYLAFWVALPIPKVAGVGRPADFGRMLAFGGVAIGVAFLAYGAGLGSYVVPIVVVGLGVAILWQQWGSAAPTDLIGSNYRWARLAAGVVLVASGLVALLIGEIGWLQGLRAVAVVLLILGGVAVIALPLLLRTYRDLVTERRALIREQERSEIAAQVHDSVLQTLTLIQKNADKTEDVRKLARAEERRLRSWLYDPVQNEHTTLAAALRFAAARIEDDYGASVDVVQVGDADMDGQLEALLSAAGEAIVNAAKHGSAGGDNSDAHVDVYCEVSEGLTEVFVRDRGPGFVLANVPGDRRGISESIVGRMDRAGGSAQLESNDRGTEVRLVMQRGSS